MKFARKAAFAAIALVSIFVIGCTAAQLNKAATVTKSIQTTAQKAASATTQPAAKMVEEIFPAAEPAINLFGVIASSVAGVFGLATAGLTLLASSQSKTISDTTAQLNTQAVATSTSQSAIGEILEDVVGFKNPGEPWTPKVEKLLLDLGHEAVALVQK